MSDKLSQRPIDKPRIVTWIAVSGILAAIIITLYLIP